VRGGGGSANSVARTYPIACLYVWVFEPCKLHEDGRTREPGSNTGPRECDKADSVNQSIATFEYLCIYVSAFVFYELLSSRFLLLI
jgi:hypothetical protein